MGSPGHAPTVCHQELQDSGDVLETLLKMTHGSMNSFNTQYLRPAQGQGLRITQ